MILWPNTINYLILKKDDYYNAKISELEKTANNLDAKLSGNASNQWTTLEKERMFHQSRKKIGYSISTIFIQMNLLTQRSKTFAMSYDKMYAMVNTLVL